MAKSSQQTSTLLEPMGSFDLRPRLTATHKHQLLPLLAPHVCAASKGIDVSNAKICKSYTGGPSGSAGVNVLTLSAIPLPPSGHLLHTIRFD